MREHQPISAEDESIDCWIAALKQVPRAEPPVVPVVPPLQAAEEEPARVDEPAAEGEYVIYVEHGIRHTI